MATLATGESLVLSQRDSENKMLLNHSSSMVCIRSDRHEEEGLHEDRALASGRWKASLLTSPSLSCGLFLVSTGFYSLFQTLLWRLRSCCGWVWLEPSLAGTVFPLHSGSLDIFQKSQGKPLCSAHFLN